MEMEEDQEEFREEEGGPMEGEEEANYGFTPFEEELEKEEPKEPKDMTPEAQALRYEINKLVCRYPQLKPRSSFETIRALENYNTMQLKNIYDNCLNDLQTVRGTPSSEMVTNMFCGAVEKYTHLRDYRERCLEDLELQRSIEGEMLSLLFWGGNKMQVVFRFVNNAYKCYYQLEDAPNKKVPESEATIQKGIQSIFDEQEKRQKEAADSEDDGEPKTAKRNRVGDVGDKNTRAKKKPKRVAADTTPV
jgi:hypothetical protein